MLAVNRALLFTVTAVAVPNAVAVVEVTEPRLIVSELPAVVNPLAPLIVRLPPPSLVIVRAAPPSAR